MNGFVKDEWVKTKVGWMQSDVVYIYWYWSQLSVNFDKICFGQACDDQFPWRQGGPQSLGPLDCLRGSNGGIKADILAKGRSPLVWEIFMYRFGGHVSNFHMTSQNG